MRKYFLLLTATLLSTSLLLRAQVSKTSEKDKPRIKGSGNVITRDVSVQPFDQLSSNGVFNIILKQGDKEDVKIEADDNLQDLFEVKNESSRLSISMKKDVNFSSKKSMKVYVTFKKLKSMELKMVGSLTADNKLSFDDLDIKNESVGSVDLNMTVQALNVENKSVGTIKLIGKAENAIIKNEGIGSVKAGDFIVQKMDIENSGVGSAEVNAEKELKVKDSLLGKVSNKGNASVKRMNKLVI